MANLKFYRVPTSLTWSASGSLTQELSPTPLTTCGMILQIYTDVTTTTGTWYDDPWYRLINTLTLSGQVGNANKTFFDFRSSQNGGMRLPTYMMRRELGKYAFRPPSKVADNTTNGYSYVQYIIHFGTQPFKPNGDFNWMDLSGGIPPQQKGSFTLNGTWGAAAAMGSANVTLNAATMDIILYGPQQSGNDGPAEIMPRAFPVWSMAGLTIPSATTGIWGQTHDVSAGNFIRSIPLLVCRGSGYPRDRQVFNSIKLYHQLESRDIIAFGGRGATVTAAGNDMRIAEAWTQLGLTVPGDLLQAAAQGSNAPGVPVVADGGDIPGFIDFRLVDYSTRVHPLYGADTRKITTGNLQLVYGLNNVTTVCVDMLYQRYELNPEHPANVGT